LSPEEGESWDDKKGGKTTKTKKAKQVVGDVVKQDRRTERTDN
jgi:predicted Rdx family selenoprotein